MPKRSLRVLLCASLSLAVYSALFYAGADTNSQNDKTFAPTAIQLQPFLSALTGPIFATNAKDGTNRIFIVEQQGIIKVVQPGSTSPTVFMDITARVLDGGERGLLGLAFHPQYAINGRFFVYYTRDAPLAADDGDIVISEFHVSAANMNLGDPASEIPLLTIEHTLNSNHNGGMIEFGPDGYLYAGTGDGGSANDPPNNAQNINSYLGKMLRIDINTPNGPIPYSSPPTNPFVGVAGLDEIFAYGLRNPWRWAFDRGGSNQLYLSDVGQNSLEEIDIITLGGNYGWRIMEGDQCNPNINGGVCTPPAGHIPPIAEYSSAGARCSITGGYIYRGAKSAVPVGAYIYGDYCTGEILHLLPASPGGVQTILLDTTQNITSFGEDEAGEVYVVGQGGTVQRIANTPAPPACVMTISETSQTFTEEGGTGSFTITAAGDCNWLAVSHASWIDVTSARSNTGTATVNFLVKENSTGIARLGTIYAAGNAFTVVQAVESSQCIYVISPKSNSFPASGGTGSITVTSESRCAWQVSTTEAWITITSGCCGTGTGTVNYTVGANSTGGGRKGAINVAGRTFTVKQKG